MRQENNLRKKIEDYSYGLIDVLADNVASKIYKGMKENTKETVAIKVIDIKGFKNKQDKKALEIEIDVLRKVHHSNILRCLDVYSTFNNCYIITEYCDGGDLKSVLDQRKTKFTYS
jgi:serine/threonine protein kinase